MNLFERLPPVLFKQLLGYCTQMDKSALLRGNRALYDIVQPFLYGRIVIFVGVRSYQSDYPLDSVLITKKKSLKRLFRSLLKRLHNVTHTTKLAHLIYSLKCYHIIVPKDHSPLSYGQLLQYQQDCFDCMHSYQKDKHQFPTGVSNNLLKLIMFTKYSCIDLQLPNIIYAKLTHNSNYFDYLRSLKMKRGIGSKWKLVQMFVKGELSLDLYKIGISLRLTLNNLHAIAISFADPNITRKILMNCDSDTLRSLKLLHFASHMGDAVSINRLFHLYDEFFKTKQVRSIFSELDDLSIALHNGYSRILFKKFWFSLYHLYISNNGKLQLSSFELIEQVDDYSEIEQLDTHMMDGVRRADFVKHSSLLTLVDLMAMSAQFTLFDLIDFEKLTQFDLIMSCFPEKVNIKSFRATYLKKFQRLLKHHATKQLNFNIYARNYTNLLN